MRKQTVIVTVLILSAALGGCKKREAVDLSSIHTTAAVETQSLPPETEQLTEGSTKDDQEQLKETSSQYSLKTDIKTYTEGSASVQYPLISNMKDTGTEQKLNELLKHNAIGVIDACPLAKGESLTVQASIEAANLKRITVVYTGERKGGSASDVTPIFYSNTVDVDTLHNLGLKDFADAYTVAGYIASGDYELASKNGDEAAVRSYINGSKRNLDYYYKGLSSADFTGGYQKDGSLKKFTDKTWPKYFSYEKYGAVYVSVPVTKELGGYALIKYTPDNK